MRLASKTNSIFHDIDLCKYTLCSSIIDREICNYCALHTQKQCSLGSKIFIYIKQCSLDSKMFIYIGTWHVS